MFRAMIAERFPDHVVLGEEFGRRRPARRALPLGLRSARRHDELRARPADLLLVAGARDRRRARGRRGLRSNRQELFTAERGVGAWLNGEPLHGVGDGDAHRLAARHRLSLRRARQTPERYLTMFGAFSRARAPCVGSARRRWTSAGTVYVRGQYDGYLDIDGVWRTRSPRRMRVAPRSRTGAGPACPSSSARKRLPATETGTQARLRVSPELGFHLRSRRPAA